MEETKNVLIFMSRDIMNKDIEKNVPIADIYLRLIL